MHSTRIGCPKGAEVTVRQMNEWTPLLQKETCEPDRDVPYKNVDAKQFGSLLICILMAYVIAFFDSTFMASSHPVITSDFHASHVASWLSTSFYLCSTVTQPLYGRLSDAFGRRSVYLPAMAIFGLSTAWCACAQSIGSLIAARAVCGLGAGGILALSDVLMADIIKLEHRGIYQSYLTMACGSGSGLGVALGGVLCDRIGWRAAFGIQVPFIAGFMLLAYTAVPSGLGPCLAKTNDLSVYQTLKTFDSLGAVTLTVTITGLVLGINLGGNVFPWDHPVVLSSLAAFAAALALLVVIETRVKAPVLPPELLSSVPFGNIIWSNFLGAMNSSATLFNVPLFLQAVRQTPPTASGLIMMSPLLGVTVASSITGFFVKRTGHLKPPAIVGVVLMLIGPVMCSFLSIHNLPVWTIVLLIPWTSIGQGFLYPASTISVLALSEPGQQAMATTTLGLSRSLGSMMGVAVSSWILQNFLNFYLNQLVGGDEGTKWTIIARVRKSVKAISHLEGTQKTEGEFSSCHARVSS